MGTLGALNYVVRRLRELPGRKSVLLISDGIRIFSANNISLGGRVLDRLRGNEVLTGETKPLDATNQPDLKRLVAGGAMQLGSDMEPGEYVLQVVAQDPLAKEKHRTATQWIDFEIVR